jgi:hypothetical protein
MTLPSVRTGASHIVFRQLARATGVHAVVHERYQHSPVISIRQWAGLPPCWAILLSLPTWYFCLSLWKPPETCSVLSSPLSLSLYSSPRTLVVGVVLPFLAGEEEWEIRDASSSIVAARSSRNCISRRGGAGLSVCMFCWRTTPLSPMWLAPPYSLSPSVPSSLSFPPSQAPPQHAALSLVYELNFTARQGWPGCVLVLLEDDTIVSAMTGSYKCNIITC